jgi:putative FmdB family regulatory protein
MPFYNFLCKECGYTFDENLPIDKRDEPIESKCPQCGKESTVERTMGSVISIWKCSLPTKS